MQTQTPLPAQALSLHGRYVFECFGADGKLKWRDVIENTVVTTGKNEALGVALAAATQHTAWYIGLKGTGSVVAGDTLASHAGWAEINPYSGNRPAWTPGAVAAGSVDNSAAKASFAITSGTTVYGAFAASVNTGTSGILYSAGDFSGSRAVVNGDTLNVTVTFTA